ncbi:CoB--CoM heterodisulfide reductase iron-sulfur subunit B family protein [Carboxydothermus pertinax]|uniref:Succinate dehydrogenase subunit C n=1 Tax=Carboxydothermus pertinax TaxID=870242 RepID=A0A1L8CU96_9THEO|nr:CoB--CoM heterodisulfide reductase iron-sulfur subunit B family protein [Carboxydothermus pertinax]GAV22490.1 succinate dehydrogenase subunit C [Carboxydothermus pertinax]
MKTGYYPGCSLHSTASEYNDSVLAVVKAINNEVKEIDDWNCCGATAGHSTAPELAIGLPLRNLMLAEKEGLEEVLVPCAACYNLFKTAQFEVSENPNHSQEVVYELEHQIGIKYQNKIKILNFIEYVLKPENIEKIKKLLKRPLTDLKIAAYYGCLLLRPHNVVGFDNPERPTKMEQLLEVLGATAVRWSAKSDCCGGSQALSKPNLVVKLVGNIITNARDNGAQLIVTACPLCQANLDGRQINWDSPEQNKELLPVLYISELIGYALGLPTEKWFAKHLVPPSLKD